MYGVYIESDFVWQKSRCWHEYSYETLAGQWCINFYCQYLSVKIINHVKGTKTFTSIEWITHKISRPYLVRLLWNKEWPPGSRWNTLFGTAFLIQLQLAVHAIDTLMIPGKSFSSKRFIRQPEPPARMPGNDVINCINNCTVITTLWWPVVGRPR